MWKKVSSKTIFEHSRITLAEDTVELPNGAQVPYLKYVSKNDSVMVICIRADKVLLQREYSYPPNEVLYQFPGGKVEKGESVEDAARRELIEEAGLESTELQPLGYFYMDNRRSEAKLYVYLASEPVTTEKQGGDLEEDISSHWVSVKELQELMRKGEIVNQTLLAGWSLYVASQSEEETSKP